MLRESPPEDPPLLAMVAGDPANPYALPLDAAPVGSLARPRGPRGLLVMQGGEPLLSADSRLRRVSVRADAVPDAVAAAVRTLVVHATRAVPGRKRRDIVVEQVDGQPAAASRWVAAFTAGGFRVSANGLRYYTAVS